MTILQLYSLDMRGVSIRKPSLSHQKSGLVPVLTKKKKKKSTRATQFRETSKIKTMLELNKKT